jgi:chitin disaccharide deacetylase
MSERVLIVNADDFGRSQGINEGVSRAHEEGIVTSATLMVRAPAAEAAAAYSRRSSLSVGLHLDLGEWEYRDGEWHTLYEVVEAQRPEAVADEIERQLKSFERLAERPPTHLDSHQHVHREEPVRSALLRVGERLGVPVRHFTPGVAYSGAFYGQDSKGAPFPDAITVEGLVRTIEALPARVTELACHPAAASDYESTYRAERIEELATLCDPRVRATIDRCGVALCSFADLARSGPITRP